MKRAIEWLLVALAGCAVWVWGLKGEWVYDDVGMIVENPYLADRANVWAVATGRTVSDGSVLNGRRPVVLLSYFADRAVWGLNAKGWRLSNLAWHLGCAWMLGAMAWRAFGRRRWLAAAAGLLFAIHPLTSEVVHSPGFRADAVCLFWMLAGLHAAWSCAGSEERKAAWGWGAAALAGAGVALLSKESAVVWPLLAAGLLWAGGRWGRRGWALCGAGAAVGALFFAWWGAGGAGMQAVGGGAWNGESLRGAARWFSAPALWARQLRYFAVPWPLNVTPGFEPAEGGGDARVWAGLFWAAVFALGAAKGGRRTGALTLGLLWMGAAFLPVSNLWPLLHPVADRYAYAGVAGFALAAGWVTAGQSVRGRVAGLAMFVLFYGALTAVRLWQWQTPERLWSAAYYQNRQSADAATWLGLLREEAGDAEGAEAFFRAATEANPQAAEGWANLGRLLGQRGECAEAVELLERAAELAPGNRAVLNNLAMARQCAEDARRAAERENAKEDGP